MGKYEWLDVGENVVKVEELKNREKTGVPGQVERGI